MYARQVSVGYPSKLIHCDSNYKSKCSEICNLHSVMSKLYTWGCDELICQTRCNKYYRFKYNSFVQFYRVADIFCVKFYSLPFVTNKYEEFA